MKYKEEILQLGLKAQTANDLYQLLRKEEESLSQGLRGILLYLENQIMNKVTIEEMEELID